MVMLELLAILGILISAISLICIPTAFLLLWLDEKGVIEKITNIFRRKKDER